MKGPRLLGPDDALPGQEGLPFTASSFRRGEAPIRRGEAPIRLAEGQIGPAGAVAGRQGAGGAAPATTSQQGTQARAGSQQSTGDNLFVAAGSEAEGRSGSPAGAVRASSSAFTLSDRRPVQVAGVPGTCSGAAGTALAFLSSVVPQPFAPPDGRPEYRSKENPLGLSSIHACINETRFVHAWPIAEGPNGENHKVRRFRCNSLRHAGACRKAKAASNYDRIKKTLECVAVDDISFWVLTLDQRAFTRPDETDAQSRYRAFRELNQRWSKLRKRLNRRFGVVRFISTVEQHRSGWPHLNVIAVNSDIGALCRGAQWLSSSRESRFNREIHSMVTGCGFGRMMTVEAARSKQALAQYIAKLSTEVELPAMRDQTGRLAAEVSKITQAPVHAPRHFRALRASVGFLVPPKKNDEYTGMMLDADGVRAAAGYQARRGALDVALGDVERWKQKVDALSGRRLSVVRPDERPGQLRPRTALEQAQAQLEQAEKALARARLEIEKDKEEAIALAATRRGQGNEKTGNTAMMLPFAKFQEKIEEKE